jgi:hypothetical protein
MKWSYSFVVTRRESAAQISRAVFVWLGLLAAMVVLESDSLGLNRLGIPKSVEL